VTKSEQTVDSDSDSDVIIESEEIKETLKRKPKEEEKTCKYKLRILG
jgi:hypothetical protein